MRRGFGDDLAMHDETLITAWNNNIRPNDEVWLLGDFTFHKKEVHPALFARLNGKKHLVVGNHDPRNVRDLPWESVHDLVGRRFAGHKFIMCHYPMLTWANAHAGVWHLHGHSHGNLSGPLSTRLDVGVDNHSELRPFHLDEVISILSTRTYHEVDHHA